MPKQIYRRALTAKNLLTLFGLLALGLVIVFNRSVLAGGWHLLRQVRWYIIAAVVLVQVGSYWLNALYYRSILGVFNSRRVAMRRLFEGALATNYVSYTVPSAGAAGAGFLSQVLSPEVSRGESVLAQLMRSVLDALALLLLLPPGIILLSIGHRFRATIIRECLILTALVLAATGLLWWLIQHETEVRRRLHNLFRRVQKRVPRLRGEKALRQFVDSFYRGYHAIFDNKQRMMRPFAWSVLYVTVELLTVYLVFVAFSKIINPGIVIIAYLIANIASIFGGLIFSVGAFEVGMAGTCIALGVAPSLAFSITIIYRSLNLVIGLPPGFYFYHKYLP